MAERLGVGGAAATPVGEETQRGGKIAAVGGERVGHPRRALLIRRRHHDPLALEPPKPIGEDVRGDAGNGLAERAETPRPIEQGLDEQQAPAVADSIERRLERRARAVGIGCGHRRDGRCVEGACHAALSVVDCKSQVYRHDRRRADIHQEHETTCPSSRNSRPPSASVAEQVGPSIVGIGRGTRGSGVVIAPGKVITNAHNIRGDEVTVTFADGRSVRGTVAGFDGEGDLAVIDVDTAGATPLEWGDGSALSVGAAVFGAGASHGGGTRVTFGLVSAVARAFRGPGGRRIEGSVEHTAPLAPGSSGGALLDASGRLVGINTNRIGEGFYLAPAGRR